MKIITALILFASASTAPTIAGIAAAVAGHVQACFSNERSLAELIDAASSAEELAEVDLESGWPT